MSGAIVRVRLLLADAGSFQETEITVPAEALERHERLIDLLQEEPDVLRRNYVDLARLCAAQVIPDASEG